MDQEVWVKEATMISRNCRIASGISLKKRSYGPRRRKRSYGSRKLSWLVGTVG